ncbi:MAG: type II toxin-antitoxin system RelE/ParE family toxin [Nanoarchaeota archaeon]|nr:type II toxin-antitoxin system RelE/ParE family toxin [Nanoarchaeota archaeon]
MFQIEHTSHSSKFLKKADTILRERVIKKIELLKDEPVPRDAKSLAGEQASFRVRVGDYRILYKVKWNERVILIANIDKRARVYN